MAMPHPSQPPPHAPRRRRRPGAQQPRRALRAPPPRPDRARARRAVGLLRLRRSGWAGTAAAPATGRSTACSCAGRRRARRRADRADGRRRLARPAAGPARGAAGAHRPDLPLPGARDRRSPPERSASGPAACGPADFDRPDFAKEHGGMIGEALYDGRLDAASATVGAHIVAIFLFLARRPAAHGRVDRRRREGDERHGDHLDAPGARRGHRGAAARRRRSSPSSRRPSPRACASAHAEAGSRSSRRTSPTGRTTDRGLRQAARARGPSRSPRQSVLAEDEDGRGRREDRRRPARPHPAGPLPRHRHRRPVVRLAPARPGLPQAVHPRGRPRPDTAGQEKTAAALIEALGHFGVDARVIGMVAGPHITRYELRLAPGTKVAQGRPAQGRPRLRAGRVRHPRPRADPRQAGRRRRGPQRAPPDRPPRRRAHARRRRTGRR